MSLPTSDTPTTEGDAPTGSDDRAAALRRGLIDAGIVLAWFLVVGTLGAVAWWQLVDLPEATRSGSSIVLEPDQLGKAVNIDAWFFAIALVGGLVSGVALLNWRHRDPLLMVLLVTLGGGVASVLMAKFGQWLGPSPQTEVLRHKPNGAHAPVLLELTGSGSGFSHATGVLWVWPAAAALGALVYLWVLKDPTSD